MIQKPRTLLVGLDSACWQYIEPLLQSNRLPTLQHVMSQGIWGILHSTMPPWTPAAWSTIITGKNPGKHGVFDMIWRLPGTYDMIPVNAQIRQGTPFWQRLNGCGVRVGLVNVPFTYPPTAVEGFVVCGFGTPASAKDVAYPDQAQDWLQAQHEAYKPVVDADLLKRGEPKEVFRAENGHQANLVEIALSLAKRHHIDILVINLMLTDHANHKMPEMAQVEQALCETDKHLAELLQGFTPDHVMVISDHGSNRLKGNFMLEDWLRDHGYYVPAKRSPDEYGEALNWVLVQWFQEHYGWSGPLEQIVRRATRAVLSRLPRSWQQRFWHHLEQIIPFAQARVEFRSEPDYEHTSVFPGSAHSGLLYLNRHDWEPQGTVTAEVQAALLTELAEKLAEIVDPDTGEPLFSHVYRAEDVYTGQAVAHGPALILDSYDSAWNLQLRGHTAVVDQARDKYFVSGKDYGWHSRDGIFVFSGAAFAEGQSDCEAHLVDVASTLLYLYDVPIPEDYDGRVLTELMSPDFVAQHPICSQPGDTAVTEPIANPYAADEEETLFEYLKALGYME